MIWLRKPHLAVGLAMVVSLMAPTWVEFPWGPLMLNTGTFSGAILLISYCLHPQGKLRLPIHWLDGVFIALVVVHLVSEFRVGEVGLPVTLRAVGEWGVPYLAGRCLAVYRGGVTAISPWFVAASILLGLGALSESISGVNLWESIFCDVDDLVDRSRERRYELLYRASGPTRHPIFLGVIFLTLLPWSVVLIERGRTVPWRVLGGLGLTCICVGILATVSRGPLLALAIAAATASMLCWPAVRKPAAVIGVIGILGAAIFWQQVGQIIQWSDSRPGRGELVVVSDEAEIFTGTRNRLLVWQIYAPLVVRGGPFGFATEAVSSFPPNIPGLPSSARSVGTLGIVDNSYLLIGLRFGWLGISLFVTAVLGAIATVMSLRASAGFVLYPHGAAFLTALASTLVAVSLEICSVFSSYEFMFWVIFCFGLVAGTGSLRKRFLRNASFDDRSESAA